MIEQATISAQLPRNLVTTRRCTTYVYGGAGVFVLARVLCAIGADTANGAAIEAELEDGADPPATLTTHFLVSTARQMTAALIFLRRGKHNANCSMLGRSQGTASAATPNVRSLCSLIPSCPSAKPLRSNAAAQSLVFNTVSIAMQTQAKTTATSPIATTLRVRASWNSLCIRSL